MGINTRQEEILLKSIDVMYLKGYHGTSIQELSDAANIPKSTFYSFFKSKEEYALIALDYYSNVINEEHLIHLLDTSIKPLQRILNFYIAKIDNLESKAFKYGCFVGNLTQEMSDINESFTDLTNTLHENVTRKIYECIIEAKMIEGIDLKQDAYALADYINFSWQGALIRMKSTSNKKPLDEFIYILKVVLLKV